MKTRANHCSDYELSDVLKDAGEGLSSPRAVAHLDSCPECQRKLTRLAGADGEWTEVRAMLCPLEGDSTDSGQLMRHRASGSDRRPLDEAHLKRLLSAPVHPELLGRLDRYNVERIVGAGGFGVVLKAFDASLNRYVAIKVLSPQLANSGAARRRFAREAQAAAVVHEHVVAIHSVAEHDGLPYLVMPYIAGCSLQERLDEHGPLETSQVLRIGMQIAAGLAAAHAQGLVHRDIKPANILLESDVERVKITDFGLARTIDDASLTASGIIAGTPQYMAPEQARGETVDHRSDLFSLGSVLYAMCTGHSPFRAETFMAIWRRLCIDTPRPVREINPAVPDWLAEIIEHLHKKNPAERIQTADEVADLLGRHLAHLQQPAVAPRPARLRNRSRVNAWMRLSAWGAICAAACLLVFLAWWQTNGSSPHTEMHAATLAEPDAAEWSRELEQAKTDLDRLERELQRMIASGHRKPPPAARRSLTDLDNIEQDSGRDLLDRDRSFPPLQE